MSREVMMKKSKYAKSLDKMGFCVLPLLQAESMAQLLEVYLQSRANETVMALSASHSRMPPEQSIEVSQAIKSIVMPALEQAFESFEFFIGGFMVKEAMTEKEFPLHQDWNIVEESLYTSYQIWIPLALSQRQNGGMYVLPGSHRFYSNYRSGSYGMPIVELDAELAEVVVDMTIPKGEALVYHNSLFHASYPNMTEQNRISCIVSIYQKNAPLIYCDKVNGATNIYEIDAKIFLRSLAALEQGGAPLSNTAPYQTALNPIDNSAINPSQLLQHLQHHYLTIQESEPRQLHIINDSQLENTIQKQGFAVIDLIDSTTVDKLMATYHKYFSERLTSTGRFTTMEHTSAAQRRYFHDYILNVIRPSLDNFFRDYEVPIASYFVKYAQSQGDLNWHSDSSLLLNAHLEPHYAIWCPLLDVTIDNGALCVIEGSHQFNAPIIIDGLGWPFAALSTLFDVKKNVLRLRAGQAVLFDIRTIHHATPNSTDIDRICFSLRITHRKSQYYDFRCDTGSADSASIYTAGHDIYLRDDWNTGAMPDANLKVGEIQNPYAKVNLDAVRRKLGSE